MDDMKHGYGTYKYSNGNEYCGKWKDDKRQGHLCIFTYSDGSKYEGEWVDEGKGQIDKIRRHGNGRLTTPDGMVYKG